MGLALCNHVVFKELATSLRSPAISGDRLRDLFPLPLIGVDYVGKLDGIDVVVGVPT